MSSSPSPRRHSLLSTSHSSPRLSRPSLCSDFTSASQQPPCLLPLPRARSQRLPALPPAPPSPASPTRAASSTRSSTSASSSRRSRSSRAGSLASRSRSSSARSTRSGSRSTRLRPRARASLPTPPPPRSASPRPPRPPRRGRRSRRPRPGRRGSLFLPRPYLSSSPGRPTKPRAARPTATRASRSGRTASGRTWRTVSDRAKPVALVGTSSRVNQACRARWRSLAGTMSCKPVGEGQRERDQSGGAQPSLSEYSWESKESTGNTSNARHDRSRARPALLDTNRPRLACVF
ncbi:hypothetical protein DMC30DRAFT_36287 [Rhodotorula diobovata]|uniref:Uncharacterized protein n=1 Tax=Rhodotorula diobovata TaxID=5288 RepID=A0A5C5FPP9_9BASI|nr:hypothetical protein DMC30DRAFT_36287 [Rhodotorula diobovata]